MRSTLFLSVLTSTQAQGVISAAPTCATSNPPVSLTPIIGAMTESCQTLLGGALASGTSLSNSQLCPCFLEVDEATAMTMNCKALTTDSNTLYQTYQECQQEPAAPKWSWSWLSGFSWGFKWLGQGWGWGWGSPGWGWVWN